MKKDNLVLKLKNPTNPYGSKQFNKNHEWFIHETELTFT